VQQEQQQQQGVGVAGGGGRQCIAALLLARQAVHCSQLESHVLLLQCLGVAVAVRQCLCMHCCAAAAVASCGSCVCAGT
jgi:hypothetical protein